MDCIIRINLDNAEFQDDPKGAIDYILFDARIKIPSLMAQSVLRSEGRRDILRDGNGNTVGSIEIIGV